MATRLSLGAAAAGGCLLLVASCGSTTAEPEAGSASPATASHSPSTQSVVADPVKAVKKFHELSAETPS